MLLGELPQQLQKEFEQTVRSLYGHDHIKQALVEAIELWLAQQREKLIQAEATVNNRAFETLKAELAQRYPGKWIVIAYGKLQGVAEMPEELNHVAPTALHRIVMQVGQIRPKEVELGWQMTFI